MGIITIFIEGGGEIELTEWPVGPGDTPIVRILVAEIGAIPEADNDASILIDAKTAARLGKLLTEWAKTGKLPIGKGAYK